jgi:hypothetical protein
MLASMRRTERHPVEMSVVWSRAGREIRCSAIDVNAHGLFLRTNERVEPETLMHLAVRLPDRVLEMFAVARFAGETASGPGIGAEIFLIDDVSQRHWVASYDRLCAEQASTRRLSAMGG